MQFVLNVVINFHRHHFSHTHAYAQIWMILVSVAGFFFFWWIAFWSRRRRFELNSSRRDEMMMMMKKSRQAYSSSKCYTDMDKCSARRNVLTIKYNLSQRSVHLNWSNGKPNDVFKKVFLFCPIWCRARSTDDGLMLAIVCCAQRYTTMTELWTLCTEPIRVWSALSWCMEWSGSWIRCCAYSMSVKYRVWIWNMRY